MWSGGVEMKYKNVRIENRRRVVKIMTNLKQDIVYELHRDARKNFQRSHVIMRGIDETWQIDLVEMREHSAINRNHNYILTVIDNFSKFAYAKKLKNKTGTAVSSAMESIFKEARKSPKNIHSDAGSEFFCKPFQVLMKKYKINHYKTHSHLKVS